jgi:hypothetical protein
MKRKVDQLSDKRDEEAEGLSELEHQRLKNMQRNAEYLAELGIVGPTSFRKKAIKRKSDRKNLSTEESVNEIGLRRSRRIADIPIQVNYKESSISAESKTKTRSTMSVTQEISSELPLSTNLTVGTLVGFENESNEPEEELFTTIPSSSSSSRRDFCSENNANLSLLLGTDFLGHPCEEYGKAAIMQKSSLVNHHQIRFNKYSGVVEWQNALFLWVNIGGSQGYKNTFEANGEYISWFGGSSMHKESRIVKRLLHPMNNGLRTIKSEVNITKIDGEAIERNASLSNHSFHDNQSNNNTYYTNGLDNDDQNNNQNQEENPHTVLLFVRLEGEGYACLGRVEYVAANLETSPIEIKWRLRDYSKLYQLEYFQNLLKASLS